MLFYNTNESFGMGGPFEAESAEHLADDMVETFTAWAVDYAATCDDDVDLEFVIKKYRDEYIDGLLPVCEFEFTADTNINDVPENLIQSDTNTKFYFFV